MFGARVSDIARLVLRKAENSIKRALQLGIVWSRAPKIADYRRSLPRGAPLGYADNAVFCQHQVLRPKLENRLASAEDVPFMQALKPGQHHRINGHGSILYARQRIELANHCLAPRLLRSRHY